jgi:hypothetical protein
MAETWQTLVGIAALMVLYVASVTVLGREPSVPDLMVAVLFGGIGWLLGQRLTDRFVE